MSKEMKKAVAYLRTSSAANVGADKDSDKRQLAAISAYAKSAGYQIVGTYYDAAVSGADPIHQRAGFAEMLTRVATNGAKTILLESPDRFARDLAVQLAGHDMLKGLGIDIIPASAPDFFLSDTPTAVLVRQVLGAIAEFEKASIVAKLAAARKRKRLAQGKCEGRKSFTEASPELVQMVKALRGNGRGKSLRAISAELADQGIFNERGQPFNPKSISVILKSKAKSGKGLA
jgi:DNA invertase Pin-like site-specific DNA recombinase